MEKVRINFPYCLKRAPFAVWITVFLYLKCSLLCVEVLKTNQKQLSQHGAEGGDRTEERRELHCYQQLYSVFLYTLSTVKAVAVLLSHPGAGWGFPSASSGRLKEGSWECGEQECGRSLRAWHGILVEAD